MGLAFALLAAACSWNALGAPFALITGLGAVVLAARALRRGAPRRVAGAALALALLAVAASAVVLGAAAGVGVGPGEQLGVEVRSAAELRGALDDAAAGSREARAPAAAGLERLPPPEPSRAPPAEGAGGAGPAR
jgi:hypothetical protein